MSEMVEKAELNLDTKVSVKNLAGWNVGFARIADGVGDVNITPNGTARLSRNEIIAQVQNGNRLFCGVDGVGSHATLYIDDKPTRVELDFESEDGSTKQNVLTEAKVGEIFSKKTQSAFEKAMNAEITTRAEKYSFMQMIKKLKLNDYSKIRYAENYTGYNME